MFDNFGTLCIKRLKISIRNAVLYLNRAGALISEGKKCIVANAYIKTHWAYFIWLLFSLQDLHIVSNLKGFRETTMKTPKGTNVDSLLALQR